MKSEVKTAPNTHPADGGPQEIAYEETPPVPQPKCPYCRAQLDEIGWIKNDQAGLVTFFHNAPACMKVINIQAMPVQAQQPRILPAGVLPRNN